MAVGEPGRDGSVFHSHAGNPITRLSEVQDHAMRRVQREPHYFRTSDRCGALLRDAEKKLVAK